MTVAEDRAGVAAEQNAEYRRAVAACGPEAKAYVGRACSEYIQALHDQIGYDR